MNDDALHLKALTLVQIADVSALLATLEKFAPGSDKVFLKERKQFLHRLLEEYESKNPALVAILQETIDRYAKHFPSD